MNTKKHLQDFRELFLEKNGRVSDIEMTDGNYDERGDLIENSIPTITTDFCEIGNYDNIVYFTFVLYSSTYDKKLLDLLKNFLNMQIYGFKDFKTIFYPRIDFNHENFEKSIKKEKYFQVNFNFNLKDLTLESLYKEYIKIRNIFTKNKVKVVNQLQIDLVEEAKKL